MNLDKDSSPGPNTYNTCNTYLTTSLSHQLQVGVSLTTHDNIMITIINQSTTYAEAMATTCGLDSSCATSCDHQLQIVRIYCQITCIVGIHHL